MLMLYLSMIDTQEEKTKFERIYERYEQKMYATAYKILNNSEDAEDIVHSSFLTIIENLDKIQEISCHKTWNYIVTIVKNKSINLYNQKKRQGNVDPQNENYFANIFPEKISAEDKFEKREFERTMAQLILELPEKYRYVLYLYYYQEMSYAEVAKELEITEVNARQISKRGKLILEERLRERGFANGQQ